MWFFSETSTKSDRKSTTEKSGFYYRTVLRGGPGDAGGPETPGGQTVSQRSRHAGPAACYQRRRDPGLLSLADTRLRSVVPADTRAHPLGTALQDPHRVDRALSGCAHGVGRR